MSVGRGSSWPRLCHRAEGFATLSASPLCFSTHTHTHTHTNIYTHTHTLTPTHTHTHTYTHTHAHILDHLQIGEVGVEAGELLGQLPECDDEGKGGDVEYDTPRRD